VTPARRAQVSRFDPPSSSVHKTSPCGSRNTEQVARVCGRRRDVAGGTAPFIVGARWADSVCCRPRRTLSSRRKKCRAVAISSRQTAAGDAHGSEAAAWGIRHDGGGYAESSIRGVLPGSRKKKRRLKAAEGIRPERATMGLASSGTRSGADNGCWITPSCCNTDVLSYSGTFVNPANGPRIAQRPGGAWEFHRGR